MAALVAAGVGLSVVGVAATLDAPAGTQALLGLAHLVVVGVASWHLTPAGRWATVALATVGWTGAALEPRGLDWRGIPWPPVTPVRVLGDLALRAASLSTLALSVAALRNASRRVGRSEDELALTLLRERDSARRDRLTRLWNARYFHEALDQEIARCRRYGRPFGLLLIDLDGFKAVNDTAGHLAGDLVLQTVGRALRASCRTTDIPARLGGDEFAVILPEASRLTVPRYAERLVAQIAAAPFPADLPRVTASVGAVAFDRAPPSSRIALEMADAAMYAAKRDGRNRFAMAGLEKAP